MGLSRQGTWRSWEGERPERSRAGPHTHLSACLAQGHHLILQLLDPALCPLPIRPLRREVVLVGEDLKRAGPQPSPGCTGRDSPVLPSYLLLQHLRPLPRRRQLPRGPRTLADSLLQLPVEPGNLLPHQLRLRLGSLQPPQLGP